MADAKPLTVHNSNSRRIVLGPPAKSKGGGRPVLLGTPDDTAARKHDAKKALPPQTAKLTGEMAAAHRGKGSVLDAVKDHFGLRVA